MQALKLMIFGILPQAPSDCFLQYLLAKLVISFYKCKVLFALISCFFYFLALRCLILADFADKVNDTVSLHNFDYLKDLH